MFKQLDFKVVGGMVIIAVLLLGGTYYYSQRSYDRFTSEIGKPPETTAPTKPATESGSTLSSDQVSTQSSNSVNKKLKVDSIPTDESELLTTGKGKEVSAENAVGSEFDPASLLTAFGIPEEVKSLLDEDVEEKDFEKAQAYLAEKYGQSPEVEAIMDRLKQMSGGPVELDDLTALFEDWIEILPEEQQENRRQLMGVLTLLNQAKTQGDRVPVNVIVGSDLDPSFLEGKNVETFKIETTETEIIDVKTETEIIDE